MNTKIYRLLGIALVALTLSAPASAKLYKWVDEEGNVHYGDKLPPEQVEKQHQQLNKRGQKVDEVGRAKSKEELEAERQAQTAEEQRRQQERVLEAAQARKDQILLDTFTAERDILIMRDDRVGAVDSNIKITESYNQQIQNQMQNTQVQIDRIEKAGNPVPANLLKKMQNLEGQLEQNNAFIERKQKERAQLIEQFKKDLRRFRELKGLPIPEEEETEESADAAEAEAEAEAETETEQEQTPEAAAPAAP